LSNKDTSYKESGLHPESGEVEVLRTLQDWSEAELIIWDKARKALTTVTRTAGPGTRAVLGTCAAPLSLHLYYADLIKIYIMFYKSPRNI